MGVVSLPRVWLRDSEGAGVLWGGKCVSSSFVPANVTVGARLRVYTVLHRDPTIVSRTCRVGSGVRVSELVPLFTVVGVGKKQVGLCHLPGSTEEDKALGPSCGHWGLAIRERCFACEEADQL